MRIADEQAVVAWRVERSRRATARVSTTLSDFEFGAPDHALFAQIVEPEPAIGKAVAEALPSGASWVTPMMRSSRASRWNFPIRNGSWRRAEVLHGDVDSRPAGAQPSEPPK